MNNILQNMAYMILSINYDDNENRMRVYAIAFFIFCIDYFDIIIKKISCDINNE